MSQQVSKLLEKGFTLHQQGKLKEAQAIYEQLLEQVPKHFDVLQLLGTLSAQKNDYQRSIDLLTIAININPYHGEIYNNLGVSLIELNQFEAAIINFTKAIDLKPNYTEAYNNRASALKKCNQLDKAILDYKHLIRLQADNATAHRVLAICYLLRGDFENGWQEYEWRSKDKKTNLYNQKRNFSQPLWLGEESLQDKTILLYAEQGFGDTIQFCRYVKFVSARGAKIILEVQPSLVTLLNNLYGVSQTISRGGPLPEFDYHCPLLSLPLVFKTRLETIPVFNNYIQSDKDKVLEWKMILGPKIKPRIGLVWSGSRTNKNDLNRSIVLDKFINLLSDNYEFISLLKDVNETDEIILAENKIIKCFSDKLNDFGDTAALCELLDLVISVDTSVAHLAASLGKPTWILVPYNPDWRWLLETSDSPWYPSVKLYRQKIMRDWDSVLEDVKSDLQKLIY